MTTLTATSLVATVAAFDVPSVRTVHPSAPTQVSTSELPLMFVRNMKVAQLERTLTGSQSGLPTFTLQICVLVEAMRQGNQFDTYVTMRKIFDELQAEIEANAEDLGLDGYSIDEGFENSSTDVSFFAVVADLRMS
jgi:hypothetical protein